MRTPRGIKGMFDKLPPEMQGAALAVFVAVLRVIYDKEETKPLRVILEAAICGGLSVTASAGIQALGLNPDWAIFAGGAIGYFGSTTVRAVSIKFVSTRIDK